MRSLADYKVQLERCLLTHSVRKNLGIIVSAVVVVAAAPFRGVFLAAEAAEGRELLNRHHTQCNNSHLKREREKEKEEMELEDRTWAQMCTATYT